MHQWIDNPVSWETQPPDPFYCNRAYGLLVRRGIEVLRLMEYSFQNRLVYLYYDPQTHILKCSNTPLQDQLFPHYEAFRLPDLISISIEEGRTLNLLFQDQLLMFEVDTPKSARILRDFFSLLEKERVFRF